MPILNGLTGSIGNTPLNPDWISSQVPAAAAQRDDDGDAAVQAIGVDAV